MNIEFPARALLSVSNKEGIQSFAKGLAQHGVSLLSTGGTLKTLSDACIQADPVESLTHFPEILDGRVKTLHPRLFAGVLAKRSSHQDEMRQHDLPFISLVAVNFYPFEEHVHSIQDEQKLIELIDIGGPSLVRAAAKNHAWVSVLVDPNDYDLILEELNQYGGTRLETRRELAKKAFARVFEYDRAIHHWFSKTALSFSFSKDEIELRYGENPHQSAEAYRSLTSKNGVLNAVQHQGKQLSYNNLLDSDAALSVAASFPESPFAVVIKHTHVCGASFGKTIESALEKAIHADRQSAFGGIFLLNQTCDESCARLLQTMFVEVVLAPSFTEKALALFREKPNVRVLSLPIQVEGHDTFRFIEGGVLKQSRSVLSDSSFKIVTKKAPPEHAQSDLHFAWRMVQHIQSNAILIAKDQCTVGIGSGQVSRVDAVRMALMKAGDRVENGVLASDAFFPFRDGIDLLRDKKIHTIIQPGGSVRDQEVIEACDEYGIAMIFTGMRGFKH